MIFYKETNFKETSIGRIPHEWETVKLGEVISHVKGKKPKVTMEEYREKSLPYLSADYLRNGIPTQFVKITGDEIIVENGDIVLLWDGSNAGEFFLGKRGVLSSTMVRLNLEKNCFDKLFMFYLLKKKECFLKGQTKGTGIPHVDKNVLKNIILPLPPFEEQRAIVGVLGVVDSAVELVDKVIAKTERLKKGLMQTLLTRGIGHKEYKQTPIGTIPKTWQIARLEDYAYIKGRIGWRGLKASEYTEKGPYLIANKHIINNKIMWDACDHLSEFRYEESPEIQLKVNDVIISKDGTIGEAAIVDNLPGRATINSTMMLLRVTNEALTPKFLFYFLQGPQFRRFIRQKVSGTSIPHLFQRDMKNLNILVPPLLEQQKIVNILSTIDEKLELEIKEKLKLTIIKQGLMDLLLTGKIRVKVD